MFSGRMLLEYRDFEASKQGTNMLTSMNRFEVLGAKLRGIKRRCGKSIVSASELYAPIGWEKCRAYWVHGVALPR